MPKNTYSVTELVSHVPINVIQKVHNVLYKVELINEPSPEKGNKPKRTKKKNKKKSGRTKRKSKKYKKKITIKKRRRN